MRIPFIAAGGRKAMLRGWPLPPPWHLLSGLLTLSTLSVADRLRLLYMDKALRQAKTQMAELDHVTVDQWLAQWHQSDRARRHLWDLITIATLNEDPTVAAAAPLVQVLTQAFFSGREESQLGLSMVGLSDLYVHAAERYITERGGAVHVKSPVDRIDLVDHQAVGVVLREGTRLPADWIISTVPAPALLKLLPRQAPDTSLYFQRIQQLKSSPIISIHLWFDREISGLPFAGLLDTHIQWFFNKSKLLPKTRTRKGYVSLVISGAHTFADWTEKRIMAMVLEELRRLFPEAREAALLRSLVIKEHQATLSPGVGCEALRPSHQSPYKNLLVGGDWSQTGLPATIESACLSGHQCASIVAHSAKELMYV